MPHVEKSKSETVALNAGYTAAVNGKGLYMNPYKETQTNYHYWVEGYNKAVSNGHSQ